MNIDWRTCDHRFKFYFGPVMHCTKCGASTIASIDGESKPIFAPHVYREDNPTARPQPPKETP